MAPPFDPDARQAFLDEPMTGDDDPLGLSYTQAQILAAHLHHAAGIDVTWDCAATDTPPLAWVRVRRIADYLLAAAMETRHGVSPDVYTPTLRWDEITSWDLPAGTRITPDIRTTGIRCLIADKLANVLLAAGDGHDYYKDQFPRVASYLQAADDEVLTTTSTPGRSELDQFFQDLPWPCPGHPADQDDHPHQ